MLICVHIDKQNIEMEADVNVFFLILIHVQILYPLLLFRYLIMCISKILDIILYEALTLWYKNYNNSRFEMFSVLGTLLRHNVHILYHTFNQCNILI